MATGCRGRREICNYPFVCRLVSSPPLPFPSPFPPLSRSLYPFFSFPTNDSAQLTSKGWHWRSKLAIYSLFSLSRLWFLHCSFVRLTVNTCICSYVFFCTSYLWIDYCTMLDFSLKYWNFNRGKKKKFVNLKILIINYIVVLYETSDKKLSQ